MADLKLWPEAAGQSGDNHCSGVIGKYHAGFMDLAFRVPAHRILKKYSKSRIVVCGHSLGGAVAHIVAINMMMHLRSNNQPTDNVKSIAFGTPYFGNDVAQQFVEEYNLSPHLLTIINEKDPVPYILRLAETIQCAGKTVMKKFERSSPGVKVILGLLTEFLIEGAKDALRRLLEELGKCKGMPKDLADLDLDSIYVPIGWYLHISCSTTKAGGGGHWNRSLLDHIGAVQYARPDIRDWKAEDFQCHRMSNYRTTFFQIARGTTYQSDDENSRSSDVTMTDPIFPARIKKLKVHVLTVKDATDDSRSTIAKKCQIEIKGDNLDFLERDVPISGLPVPNGKIAVLYISRKLVALQCDIKTDRLSAAEATIRTHFEEKKAPKINLKDIKEVPKLPYKEGLLREVVKGVDELVGGSFFGAVARGAASRGLSGALSGAWNWGVKRIRGSYGNTENA
ncbi:uncharacterized protein LOC118413747 [Branchiostoma floridae]|uniref:Uncharacterized protein LOC118413747 n=1 Tax=Branchiostoma floridae TaxID=7739 RepID=A0A9J7MNF4_BRAFL|nr:uncharacterized protein LOC118413747 [Branchiostoma floridae]